MTVIRDRCCCIGHACFSCHCLILIMKHTKGKEIITYSCMDDFLLCCYVYAADAESDVAADNTGNMSTFSGMGFCSD